MLNLNSVSKTEKRISTRFNDVKFKNPYLHCRFSDPGSDSAISYRPDGNVSNSLSVDYVQNYDISDSTGSWAIRIIPGLPYQIIFNGNANVPGGLQTTSINGNLLTAYSTATKVSRYIASTSGLMNAFGTLTSAINRVATPDVAAGRITTVTWTLQYTGAPLYANGTLSTNIIPFKLETPQMNARPIKFLNLDNTTYTTRVADTCQFVFVDYVGGILMGGPSMSKFTKSFRADTPLHGILHAKTRERAVQPYYEYPIYPVADVTNIATATEFNPLADVPPGGIAYDCNLTLLDDSFDMTEIRFNGIAGNVMGWRLIVKTCVEYDVDPASAYAPFAQNNSIVDDKTLLTEQLINSALPPALSADVPIMPKNPPPSPKKEPSKTKLITDLFKAMSFAKAPNLPGRLSKGQRQRRNRRRKRKQQLVR